MLMTANTDAAQPQVRSQLEAAVSAYRTDDISILIMLTTSDRGLLFYLVP